MRFPLLTRLKEAQHRRLIVGWLGLLAITIAVFVQFQQLANLAMSTFDFGGQGSIPSAIFDGMFPHALSAVAIVSVIGMVAIQGPVRLKSFMLGATLFSLVAFEYHWPANWATEDELRVIASLTFVFLVAVVGMSVVAVCMRAFCGWHFVVGTNTQKREHAISLSELIGVTTLSACTIAIARQTHYTLVELSIWSVGSFAYAGVLFLRLLSLADDPVVRRRGRVYGLLCFAGLQFAESLWPFNEIPRFSLATGVAVALAAFASAIVYWFLTMLPILWMKVNDWRVVSPSSPCSLGPDVDRTTS